MKHRPLADTPLMVSPICLGTMTFGTPVANDDAVRLVHRAIDHGINFIDTADIYEGYARVPGSPGGVAEAIVGNAIADRRDRVVVTTKVGNPVGSAPHETGLSAAHIKRQIDASLRRLRTDHVDIYELHKPDPATPLEESIGVMAELVAAGKVRCWGFSNFEAAQIREMSSICDRSALPRPAVSQPRYNWLERAVESEHLPLCRELHIAVTPYQPLQAGLLTGKYRRGEARPTGSRAAEHPNWLAKISDEQFDRIEAFECEAARAKLSPGQFALRWLLEKSDVTSVVVGVKSEAQLRDLLAGAP